MMYKKALRSCMAVRESRLTMNYDLLGLSEILTAVSIFGALSFFGWYFANRQEVSDDNTRMFR